jgi:hypothetical protein
MPDVTERARELRDAGLSFRLVAEALNAEGYRGNKGGLWHDGSVFRLLQPPKPPGPGRGHHGPHTEESKRKMSESHKRGFAEGRRTPSRHNAEKTHCPKGHPYDEENTRLVPGGRACKECQRESVRKRRRRFRQANPVVPRVLEKPVETLDWRRGSPGRKAYGRMHFRVRRARGSATLHACAFCAERGTDNRADVWAMRHDSDGKDVRDYIPLCDRCHTYYDRPVKPEPPSALYPMGLPGDGPGDPTLGQRRGEQQRAKTHCPHGHEYTPANTYVINRAGGRTARQCRTCMREQREARRKGA